MHSTSNRGPHCSNTGLTKRHSVSLISSTEDGVNKAHDRSLYKETTRSGAGVGGQGTTPSTRSVIVMR